MMNTKLKEVLQSLRGLKEQANLAMQLLDDNIAVKQESTELAEIQSKINPAHMNIFHAYISHSDQNSYTDIDEELFKKWFPHYEADEEYCKEEFLKSDIAKEVADDLKQYKKDGYIPYGNYMSEHFEIELKMSKQSYPSDAKAMACFYDSVYIHEDGSLDYILSGEVIEDTSVEDVVYKILPINKRNSFMINEVDFLVVTKDEFLEELKGWDRRFEGSSYEIKEVQSNKESNLISCKIKIHMEKNKDGKKIAEILTLRKDNKIPIELEIILPTDISIKKGESYLKKHFIDLYRPSRKISIKLSITA